jgi:hypothetical protein
MGTYKVIQDIESEDKLLGPFSMRQFIYVIIVIVCSLLAFKLGTVKWFLAIPFLPFIGFFGLLAAPFGHDQSSEVWLLAKIRFMFKPRKRIWNQTGIKDLVTITVPKKIEHQLTKNLTQSEVRNRLSALASTVDTRGWAVKNVDTNLFQQKSDRLVEGTINTDNNHDDEIQTEFDILDYYDNPTVQHVDQLINSTEQLRHQQLIAMMQQNRSQVQAPQQVENNNPQWFADQTQTTTAQPVPSQIPQQPTQTQPMAQVINPPMDYQQAATTPQMTNTGVAYDQSQPTNAVPQANQIVAIPDQPVAMPALEQSAPANITPIQQTPTPPVANPKTPKPLIINQRLKNIITFKFVILKIVLNSNFTTKAYQVYYFLI